MRAITLDGITFERTPATDEWAGTRVDGSLLWPVDEWAIAALDEIEALRRRLAPAPGRPLTAKQLAVLTFLRATIARTGTPPTYDEIAAHFGMRSLASVAHHVEQLERRGYLTRRHNEAQSIRLVEVTGG